MNDLMIRFRQRVANVVRRRPMLARTEVRRATRRFGFGINAWTIDPTLLSSESVVYSFGVGEDIGFDVELAKATGVAVHAFDPTPKSIEWFKRQSLPSSAKIELHEYGIAAHDGTVEFSAPKDPSHVSHTVLQGVMDDSHRIVVPVKRLTTSMRELGHTHVDLLKMDVEGAEYEVIPEIFASGVFPKQLLVEFHHRFPTVGNARTVAAIQQIRIAGYKVFNVSSSGEEISFILQ